MWPIINSDGEGDGDGVGDGDGDEKSSRRIFKVFYNQLIIWKRSPKNPKDSHHCTQVSL